MNWGLPSAIETTGERAARFAGSVPGAVVEGARTAFYEMPGTTPAGVAIQGTFNTFGAINRTAQSLWDTASIAYFNRHMKM